MPPASPLHHLLDFVLGETRQHQRCHVGLRRPGRLEFQTCGQQHEQRHRRNLVDEQRQQLPGRRVDPMQVFNHDHQRLLGGKAEHDRDQYLQSPLLLPLGAHRRQRIATRKRGAKATKRAAAPPRRAAGDGARRMRRASRAWRRSHRPRLQPSTVGSKATTGIQRTVGVVRRAAEVEMGVRFLLHMRKQRLHQAGFADSGVAGHEHDPAATFAYLLPAIAKQAQFLRAPDQRRRFDIVAGSWARAVARIMRTEAASGRLLRRRPATHAPGPANPLSATAPRSRHSNRPLDKASGGLGNDDGVGFCDRLQSRREVRRFTERGLLARGARIHQLADDHQTGCDTDAYVQALREHIGARRCSRRAQAPHAPRARRCLRSLADNRNRRAHRPPCSGRRSHRSVQPCRRRSDDRRRSPPAAPPDPGATRAAWIRRGRRTGRSAAAARPQADSAPRRAGRSPAARAVAS